MGFLVRGVLAVLVASQVLSGASLSVAAEERVVVAEATCVRTNEGGAGSIKVALTNDTDAPLRITLVRSLLDPELADFEETDLAPGAEHMLSVRRTAGGPDSSEGVLIVTSAGILQPRCGRGEDRLTLGPLPATAVAEREEAAAIGARNLSILEELRAFDALYALLHRDAQQLVSPEALTCWYTGYLDGVTTAEATIEQVTFGSWTWGGNGRTYREAAEVSYTQPFWENGVREDRTATLHLVLDRGQWRWFLGTELDWIRSLPTECAGSSIQPTGGSTTPQTGECMDADHWWTETQVRIDGVDTIRASMTNLLRSFLSQGVPLEEITIQGYAETLTRYADKQRESTPPPAAEQLNAELVAAFDTYGEAMDHAASVAAGGANPMLEPALVAAAIRALDEGDRALLNASSLVDTFLVRCSTTPLPSPTPQVVSPGGVTTGPMYPLSIQFIDGSGALLPGACVEVVAPLGTGTICDNDQGDGSPTAGVIEVRGFPWTYRVRETQPPPGYEVVEGVRTVELTTAGAELVLVHVRAA